MRPIIQKTPPWVCAGYREYVRSLRSVVEPYANAEVAHHARIIGFNGISQKPSDWMTMPLTDADHKDLHSGRTHWDMIHGEQWRHVFGTLDKAFRDGVLRFDRERWGLIK